MPTILDVAKAAGVSPKTVSRVLNNEPAVKEETRNAVLVAIAGLNYYPSQSARQMRTGQSNIIALISDEIATTPFALDMIRGAQATAWKYGKLLTVINTENDRQVEQRAFQLAREYQFDAAIYASYYHRKVQLTEARPDIPLVLLDCFEESSSLSSVVPDELQGGLDATEVLLQAGHTRIGYITYTEPIPATTGRFDGYCRALEARGIESDPSLVLAEDGQASGGYRAALKLLQSSDRPSAIFCWNDRMAMGAYDAIRKLRLSIPEDVAVMGFDNQDIIAAQLHPGLTTMQLPHYEMGAWAVAHVLAQLDDRANGRNPKPIQHKIKCRVVRREST
jgi:LacI family transcriptional regulator